MALSKTKIARMVADWKTGLYSERKLAEKHKVSRKSIRKYCTKELKGINADLVHEVAKVELKKETIKGPEKRAVEDAARQLTFEEKAKKDILKKTIAITLSATTKSMQQVSKSKELPAQELHEHVKLAQRARAVVQEDDKREVPQTAIQVQQFQLSEQQNHQEQKQVSNLEADELLTEIKKRGLPVDTKSELERLGLI